MALSAPHRLEEVYSMSIQLALCFDEVPITCETQQRYHSIAPCLAGKRSAEEQADALGLSYSTVCRWLRKFREEGMPGLFPATQYPREPQTPEHVIVTLLFYKTCAPRASDRELARVLSAITEHRVLAAPRYRQEIRCAAAAPQGHAGLNKRWPPRGNVNS